MLVKYFLPASNIFVIKYEISPPSPGCEANGANTGHGLDSRVKHCYNHTHIRHIRVFSPRINLTIMTRGHEMLAAATSTKQSHSSLASPQYGHYGRAAAGRCREYLALSHTPLQFLCHSILASVLVLLQSACNHTIVIGKIIDKMLSI